MVRNLFVATVCLAVSGLVVETSMAQRNGTEYLFAQYYTQPGASSANAEMYPAPHPVPANVGGTHYTYQPLMPHEHMYTHSRNYYSYHASPESFYCNQCGGPSSRPGYGLNKTTVRWQSGCNSVAPLPGTMMPFSRAAYRLNSRHHAGRAPGGLFGGLGAHFRGGCLGGSCGSEMDGGMSDDAGSSDMDSYDSDFDGTCDGCEESYAANWQRARQQAVSRTASEMSNRLYR